MAREPVGRHCRASGELQVSSLTDFPRVNIWFSGHDTSESCRAAAEGDEGPRTVPAAPRSGPEGTPLAPVPGRP
jgi:hypothetical protein